MVSDLFARLGELDEGDYFFLTTKYGGSTPEEVYASVVVAIRDVGAANDWGDGLREYPEVAWEMVTDEWSEATVAGTKDCWYQASISGVRRDTAFNDRSLGWVGS